MDRISKSMEAQIQEVIQQKVTENFVARDQLLLDLVQGLDHLNELAIASTSPKSTTLNIRSTKKYPKALKNSTRSTTARQRKLEEILDTPHSVTAIKGGWWSINFRREKGELQEFQKRGVAKGIDAIAIGRTIKKSRQGTQQYNRKFHKDLPQSASGEEGKGVCDLRMSLDTFCRIFHSSCPEYNLIDSFQRGRVKATLFGECGMTGASLIQHLEHYFLSKIRGGPIDRMIDTRIKKMNGDDVRVAISDIFTKIIGQELEKVGLWTVVTDRIRCLCQFEIKDFTALVSRRNLKVNNIGEISRIRQFRRSGKGVLGISIDDIMNPREIPMNLVKREADMAVVTEYNNSLKARRRARAQEEQTMKLRKQEIKEICWVVLVGFEQERITEAIAGLQEFVGMTEDDAVWAIKYGVPYFLLKQKRPAMSIDAGENLVEQLVSTGCQVLLERQFDF
jgi:hypothetical protein